MLDLTLLGSPQIKLHGESLVLKSQKAKGLLFYLAVEKKSFRRESLANLFWDDSTKDPLNSLRAELPLLRRHFSPHLIFSTYTLAFNQESSYQLDSDLFEATLRSTNPTLQQLESAIRLYHGEFLADFSVKNANPDLQEWIAVQREYYRVKAREACRRLITQHKRSKQWDTALRYAQRLLELEDWAEEHHRWVIELQSLTGDQSAALAQYNICRRKLAEVGVTPSSDLDLLYNKIQQGITLDGIQGEERLNYELKVSKPPFQVLSRNPYFVGRTEILQKMSKKLTQPYSGNFHALLGMAGIGKSAIAIELGHLLSSHFIDGILWADTASSEPESILDSWVREYGYDFSHRTDIASKAATFRSILANKKILIIFDNILDAQKFQLLLPNGNECAVIITTRDHRVADTLNAQIELVPEMTVEEGCQLITKILQNEARVRDEKNAAVTICALLQNHPMAVEIIAKRLKRPAHQKLADMANRLQVTKSRLTELKYGNSEVRTSFQLSYNQLSATLQRVYSLIAIFESRTFTSTALSHIMQGNRYTVEDYLLHLIDLSLLQEVKALRYQQNTLLSEFSLEKLKESNEFDTAQLRMVTYYSLFARNNHAHYDLLDADFANLSTSMNIAFEKKQWQALMDLADGLGAFWFSHGHFSLARQGYQWACQAAEIQKQDASRAKYLRQWGLACVEQAADREAEEHLNHSLTIYQGINDNRGMAETLYHMGRLEIERKNFKQGEQYLRESRMLCEALLDQAGIARALYLEADIPYYQKQYDEAKRLGTDALKLHQSAGDMLGCIQCYGLLADIAIVQEKFALADQYCQKALEICNEIQDEIERAVILYAQGEARRRQGRLEMAKVCLEESLRLLIKMGDRRTQGRALLGLSKVHLDLQKFHLALENALQSYDINIEIEDKWDQVYTLEHIGTIYHRQGMNAQALTKWQEALHLAKAFENHQLIDKIRGHLE